MHNAGLRRSARLLAAITIITLVLLSLGVTALMQDAPAPAQARRWPDGVRPVVTKTTPLNLAPVPNAPDAQLIVDPGFEVGSPWSGWPVQTSTNFGSSICNTSICSTNGGLTAAFAGTNWLWYGGGTGGMVENSTTGQSVTIPSGVTASLTFQMRIQQVNTPFSDTMQVKVDGVTQQTFTEPAAGEGAYTLRTINLNAFANGLSHAILFQYASIDGATNFLIDDINLTTTPVADTAPSVSSTTPTNNAIGQPRNTNIVINFSEPVNVTGNWFQIVCASSGTRNVADTVVTGGPSSFTINPNVDFATGEICTTTVFAAQVTDVDVVDPPDNMATNFVFSFITATFPAFTSEVEPNGTPATAQALPSTPVRVRGDLFIAPFSAGVDVDVYSVTTTTPNERIYAATMTGFSGGSTDTLIDILDTNANLNAVLETDDEDGTVGGSASNVGGTVLATPGTYYVRVRQFSTTSLSGTIRPYDLYVRVLSGVPTAETEPNNNGAPGPQALPANGWVSGAVTPLNDNDTYMINANAGDTIVAIMDVDPERDAPEWNGRVAIGLFNNFFLVANGSAVAGTFDDANPSEAIFFTVKATGAYQVYVDESPTTPAPTGAATNTYHLSVSVIPGATNRTCTTYAGTGGAITDAATTDFTVNIPDAKLIDNLTLTLNETHAAAATADLDVSLISPDGNEVVLFDDPPTTATAPAPQIDTVIDDEAAIPISVFGIHNGPRYEPKSYARMAYFKGMQAQGTWTLRIRDDLAGNTGTLNSWSLTVCQDPGQRCTSTTTTVVTTDFEASDAGFTHSGTADEWARGLPSGASTPITTCHSGVNCWKTDLTGTYNVSSSQDLISPNISLTTFPAGTPITLTWWQKYQMESASFDPFWVEVRIVGNPASARKVFEWKGATQTRLVGSGAGVTVQMSAGWGQVSANISSFAGQNVEVRYHLESDTSGNFSGLAVDDFTVSACNGPTAAPATISGKITTPNGQPLGGVTINLSGGRTAKTITDSNGNYRFTNIETDNFYTVTPKLVNYHFGPESRSFSLLANMTDAVFTATRDAVTSGNPIDTPDYFVRQHYLDFLGREPDDSGFNFWSDQIASCGGDADCIERRTINVSAAYFLSIEFQETGGLVDGLYRASYSRRPLYAEFMPDTRTIAGDLVVGAPGWQGQLAMNKQSFVQAWVERQAFRDAYDSLSNDSYVDTLIAHTGVSFSQGERNELASGLAGGRLNRAGVLLRVAENQQFANAKRNEAFVMMQYFGYLRRDADSAGFAFWLNKLNEFNGNFERAEMVKAFLNSGEYRARF
jgi:subtilisin-like proprotein convertase family protein